MEALEFKFGLGNIYSNIYSVAKDAIAFAKHNQNRNLTPQEVYFTFNGIKVRCYSSSEPRDIVEKYSLLCDLRG